MAETGSARKVETETNSTLGKLIVVGGEAEWAAIQTVHVADSVALECWCVANAIADQRVSNTHIHAIRFVIDRMTATRCKLRLIYTKTVNERNELVPSLVCI